MLRFYAAPAAKTFKNEFFIQWLEIARNILLKIINDFVIVKSTLITMRIIRMVIVVLFLDSRHTQTLRM